jgi:hypothetical protein
LDKSDSSDKSGKSENQDKQDKQDKQGKGNKGYNFIHHQIQQFYNQNSIKNHQNYFYFPATKII